MKDAVWNANELKSAEPALLKGPADTIDRT